jgi:hypothetical protein
MRGRTLRIAERGAASKEPQAYPPPTMEEHLSLRQKYLKTVTALMPAGALGVSLALGAATPAAASEEPQGAQLDKGTVSERLAAVRDAVTALGVEQVPTVKDRQLAFLNFRNGGWGYGPWGWNNWHNWGNGGWRGGWGFRNW